MALVWLLTRQISLALLPFAVYSIFHVATYVRGNVLPALYPAAPGASDARPKSTGAVADMIGNFIRDYYDASMTLVAFLEVLLWGRMLFSAILFVKGSWIMLIVYTAFLRARFSQSKFVSNTLANLGARGDAMVAQQGMDPRVRQGWAAAKGGLKSFVDVTNVGKYFGSGAPQGVKKAQ
jgi:hypothetical protein